MRSEMASGKRNFPFPAVVTIFLERILSCNGSSGSDTVCGILPRLHMDWLPGGPS